ncbi:MAG: Fe-S cluster assembly protein SufD [Pseudomonadota bacterium]
MTVIPMIKHTAAEEALFEAYDASGAKSADRDAAIASLKTGGLPTRRIEAWHYTDLRTALKSVPAHIVEASSDAAPLVEGSVDLALVDRDVARGEVASDDAIGKLNSAFATKGALAMIGGSVSDIMELQANVSNGANHLSHSITFKDGASATVVERQLGEDGFATAVTDLEIGDNADVTYVITQQKDLASTHLGQINISLGADAKLTLFVLNAGGGLVRQEVNIKVAGEGADFQLRGVNLIGDDQHIDVTMDLHHAVPNTESEEIIRNVVTGKGKGVFQGKIRVAQVAQKTDAKMACNTLLLTDDGDFSTKPELEIFADDVACGHGATFTDIEPSYMFYLMSRGIPERDARALLIKGFVDEIVEDLDNEPLEQAIVGVIDAWLDKNG